MLRFLHLVIETAQINANESRRLYAETIHPIGGLANTGSALNIRVYLRSSAADYFFQG